jgi:hypothetical protein
MRKPPNQRLKAHDQIGARLAAAHVSKAPCMQPLISTIRPDNRGRHEEMIAPNAAIVCLNHFSDYVARPAIPRRVHELPQLVRPS